MSHRTGPVPLPGRPRRLVTRSHHHAGIVIGPEPASIAHVRRWAAGATHSTPRRSQDVALAASELTTNALRHSRSGDPDGRVVVELLTREDHYLLRVTDDGPRPGQEHLYPRIQDTPPGEVTGGLGLRLVEAISRRGWSWLLHTNGSITVQAEIPSRAQ